MNFFTNNPFTKILSFWLIGLLIENQVPILLWLLVALWIYFGALALIHAKTKSYPFDLHLSLFLAFSFMLVAFWSGSNQKEEPAEDQQTHHFIATVLEFPSEKPNSYQCQLRLNCCDRSEFNNQKFLAYFEKDEKVDSLKPGDQVIVESQMKRIRNTGNPYAFDYQKFMANRDIYFSGYLPSNKYSRIINKKTESPLIHAERIRASLITLLKESIHDDESLQVISALTLGYRKELSPETKTYFASTGAMHILAVSGLHVGMIYIFITTLLSFLKRSKPGRLIYVFMIASLLWSYALLTGFSPSVQRATVMFCFILIGNSLRRPPSIYNSIAASAFLLLLFNPKLLHEVGFQLSYAAVTSIVFLYPRLEKLWTPRHWLFKKMWSLLSVSLAAQAGTFAFSIYYFHQFPVYFWLSNFIAIPAAYLILGLTFLFFLLSPISTLAAITCKILGGVTWMAISLLKGIDQLPLSLIENISINTTQLVFLITASITLALFIKLKQSAFFLSTTTLALLFIVSGFIEKTHYFNQKKIIVYPHEQKVNLISGRNNYLLYKASNSINKRQDKNVTRKLQLNNPVYICIDSCLHFQAEDLIVKNRILQFLNQTFQFEERKENQQQSVKASKHIRFFRVNNLEQAEERRIDSLFNNKQILNLDDL